MSLTYPVSHSSASVATPTGRDPAGHVTAPSIGRWLADLGMLVDGMGLAAIEDDVEVLVATARAAGIDSAAVGVLADRSAREVVRVRAFAHVSADVMRATAT